MRILLYVPLPPPVTGQSYAARVLMDRLESDESFEVVPIDSRRSRGIGRIAKFLSGVREGREIVGVAGECDVIYYHLSQSWFGMLKDMAIFVLLGERKRRVVAHLHGGRGLPCFGTLFELFFAPVLKRTYGRLGRVILLDPLDDGRWRRIAGCTEIRHIDNFCGNPPEVCMPRSAARGGGSRFTVLFLSNLHPDKGIFELIESLGRVRGDLRSRVRLVIAGGHVSGGARASFERLIGGRGDIEYLGIVDGERKSRAFLAADAFCLPTYYRNEGQPISLLEAYGYGLPVITTLHNGIPHIFEDRVNGLAVVPKCPSDIARALEALMLDGSLRQEISANNRLLAIRRFGLRRHLDELVCQLVDAAKAAGSRTSL